MNISTQVIGYRELGADSTMFYLENSREQSIPLQEVNVSKTMRGEVAAEVVTLSIEQKITEGEWILVMKDITGLPHRYDEVLTVVKPDKPRILRVLPNVLILGKKFSQIRLNTKGVEKNAEIHFEGPLELNPGLISQENVGIFYYSLNLQNVQPGWYSISIKNPSGKSSITREAFRINSPENNPIVDSVNTMLEKKLSRYQVSRVLAGRIFNKLSIRRFCKLF